MTFQRIINQYRYRAIVDHTNIFQVIVFGMASSAASHLPISGLHVSIDHADIAVNTLTDGYYALAAHVPQAFPALATQAYTFDITFSAPFHDDVLVTINIPPGSTFPLPPEDVVLTYRPIQIQGRVTLAATEQPQANATVSVHETNVATLRLPTRFAHSSRTPVQGGTLDPTSTRHRVARTSVPPASAVTLDATTAIATGTILRLGDPIAYLYVIVDSVDTATDTVQVRGGINRTVRQGEPAEVVTFTASGSTLALDQDIAIESGLLPLNGSIETAALQINDANPQQVEYHTLSALTDVQGYYRLTGINGRPSVLLRAVDAMISNSAERNWLINIRERVNIVNMPLRPI
jgi:hypothetical protein